jgi:hypothetical protein
MREHNRCGMRCVRLPSLGMSGFRMPGTRCMNILVVFHVDPCILVVFTWTPARFEWGWGISPAQKRKFEPRSP